ncbi:hypothetical protein AVEN_164821-1 [Araneus ventricosus]|uniref:Uncharacterized protein n=1 Tax=Araneus ventricosus TaxID=182803 RepID=A0A4Y2EXE6_ARAVE|nr:hypothetical protein AVEN_164821-1 [Araneus ventricosus]
MNAMFVHFTRIIFERIPSVHLSPFLTRPTEKILPLAVCFSRSCEYSSNTFVNVPVLSGERMSDYKKPLQNSSRHSGEHLPHPAIVFLASQPSPQTIALSPKEKSRLSSIISPKEQHQDQMASTISSSSKFSRNYTSATWNF